jgi:hypothetical protein
MLCESAIKALAFPIGVIIIPYQRLCLASVECVNDKMVDLALETASLDVDLSAQPFDLFAIMTHQVDLLLENRKTVDSREEDWQNAQCKRQGIHGELHIHTAEYRQQSPNQGEMLIMLSKLDKLKGRKEVLKCRSPRLCLGGAWRGGILSKNKSEAGREARLR